MKSYGVSHSPVSKIETVTACVPKHTPALSISPAAFCGSPIYPILRSIASVVMKRLFGDRLAGCFKLSKHWIVANRRSERAVSIEKARSFQGKSAKITRKWNNQKVKCYRRAEGSGLLCNRFMNG